MKEGLDGRELQGTGMIVSVHIPKTAGTSFREGLEQEFGQRLLTDYGDFPLSDSIPNRWHRLCTRLEVRRRRDSLRKDYDVVHGHFIASKYSSLTHDAAFCAFFRDPVNRVLSQYRYILSDPNPQHQMRRKILSEGLSLARFGSLPRQRRLYGLFTAGWPMERFAFVGIIEEYRLSLDLFNAIFGVRIPYLQSNIGGMEKGLDGRERRAVEATQRGNYRIYDQARLRFDVLCRRHL